MAFRPARLIWDDLKTRSLIKAVKQKSLLWDKNNQDYQKNPMTTTAWDNISRHTGKSPAECKKRFNQLKSSAQKALDKDKFYKWGSELTFLGLKKKPVAKTSGRNTFERRNTPGPGNAPGKINIRAQPKKPSATNIAVLTQR